MFDKNELGPLVHTKRMDVRCPSSFLQMRQCMLVLLVVFLWFIVQVLSAPLLCDRAILFQGPAKANITFEFESVTQFSVPTSKQVYNTRKFSWKNAIYGVSKSPQPLFWTFLLRLFFLVWSFLFLDFSDLFVFYFFLFSCLIFTSRVFLFPYFSDLLLFEFFLFSCLIFPFLIFPFLLYFFFKKKKKRSEKSRSGGRVRARYLVTLGCHFARQGQHLVSGTECFLRDSWSRKRGVCQYKMRLRSGKSKLWRRTGCGLTVWSLWESSGAVHAE